MISQYDLETDDFDRIISRDFLWSHELQLNCDRIISGEILRSIRENKMIRLDQQLESHLSKL